MSQHGFDVTTWFSLIMVVTMFCRGDRGRLPRRAATSVLAQKRAARRRPSAHAHASEKLCA